MAAQYKKPPIIEALCEFRLGQDTEWDLTVPGQFYERVKDQFPHREHRTVQVVEFAFQPQNVQQQIRSEERVLLFTPDRKALVQIGPRLLVVNVLKPYPSWQRFKPLIERAWQALQQVITLRQLERIGLRYINRIEFEASKVDLKVYFDYYLHVGTRLPQEYASFAVQAVFPFAEGRDRCLVRLASAESEQQRSAVILDINYHWARPGAVEITRALEWVEEAHSRVEEVFEGCITDEMRRIFNS
ncbi:TIGR04255 family protein [Rhodothermus marinus]|jgi:uncharacterized protein (TIGR04255 family)|uniref:TIGR04255 family protein n=1 Tax=Rhodothermus marinus TaxID=29549 RepID=UPI0012BA41B3|nr:TIGR04255 family protein [Rhodothermus marinus]BBM69561.1 TIGR04255 family protein [Rhodothermus marinus]BBM72543.1 TIGR04255 family protein [Rhodothermus marinus]